MSPSARLLRLLAQALPDREALVYSHAGLRYTFRQLEDESRRIARGLMASGVTTGDRVAVWATNVPEWVVLQFALAKIGAILVTVNTSLRAHEIEYLLRQSEASTLITIRGFRTVNYLDELRTIGALDRAERGRALPHLKRLFLIGENCPDDLIPYDRLRTLASHTPESQLDEAEQAVALDDVINMQYTSGTTGFPKGVMLSSRNIVNNGYWLGAGLGVHARRSTVPLRPVVPLLRLRHRRARRLRARRVSLRGRSIRRAQGARDHRTRAVHRALRRTDDVSCRARGSRVREVRPDVAADRRHGGRAVS